MESRNYTILGTLATGGTAVLYRAVQKSLDREVVIKKLHSHLVSDPNFRRRFELEAKASASLDHANIVRIIDTGAAGEDYCIVMEYIHGVTLREILDKRGPVSEETMLLIAREICLGLDHAHQRGIVHRDIKPANIMLTFEGQVKITDFGLAKLTQSTLQQTTADTLLGTPLYMSPEQAIGETVDGRSDLFSLGTICYEMLTGKQPFMGETYAAVIQRIINGGIRPPSRLNPSITRGCESIVMKALSREPAKRFRTALEMARAIESALGQESILRSREILAGLAAGGRFRPSGVQDSGRRARRGRKIIPWAAAAVIAVLGGTYMYMNPWRIDALKTGIRSMRTSEPASPEDNRLLSSQVFPAGVQIIDPPEEAARIPEPAAAEPSAGAADEGSASGIDSAGGTGADGADAGIGEGADSAASDGINGSMGGTGAAGGGTAGEAEAEEESAARAPADSAHAIIDEEDAGVAEPAAASPQIPEAPEEQAPPQGLIEIIVEPEADILVDGACRSTGNRYGPVEISTGIHTITLRQKDFREYREDIRISRGELSRRRINLERMTGSIAFDTDRGIRVFVDGKFLGITPLSSPATFTSGRHLVDLKKAGFRDWSSEVFIPADETLRLRISLSPM